VLLGIEIQTHLLDLVPVDANHGTAKGLYMLFSKSLDKLKLSADNIIGYCVDNASVMMCSKESFKVHLLNDNSNIIVNGCIYHSFHLIASSAASCIPSNIEILLQNISSYFSRSPKRQSVLKELQRYLNESQLKILSPSQTRWLAYVEEKNPAANVIYQELQNPYTKAYLYFLHFILPVFNTFNALFQSEKPLVFILYEESVRFLRIMCSKFLKAECYKNDEFDKFKNPSMILPNNDIEIGHEARKILTSCKNDANYNKFMNVIIFFYQKVVEDSLKRLPMHTLYKEFRFVGSTIVLTKSNITLHCTIKSLNYLNKKEVILNELGQIKNYFSDSGKTELPTDVLQFWNYVGI